MGETDRAPVQDWHNDFDHFDADYAADPYPIWSDLRQGCPVAHTDRYNGVYMPTRHEDISAIAHDTDHFSSRSVLVTEIPIDELGTFSSPPITSDPPEHAEHRRALLPAFAPKAIEKWTPITREICRGLLDDLLGPDGSNRSCDASEHYAKHVPVKVIARMMGIPESDGDLFRRWVHDLLEVGPNDRATSARVTHEMFDYFKQIIADHQAALARGEASDDLVDYLLQAEMGGERLDDRQIGGGLFLILLAGIDTTWSSIGSSLWHLATHPADRQRLLDEPALIDRAVEEFLRFYSPVTMARIVTDEVEFSGTTMCPGQRVLLPFPAANRDPDFIADADKFVIDRAANRHSAFGLGIHRCLGSNLARMEMKVAIQEWLARIPDFEVDSEGAEVSWSGGQIRGPRQLPLRW